MAKIGKYYGFVGDESTHHIGKCFLIRKEQLQTAAKRWEDEGRPEIPNTEVDHLKEELRVARDRAKYFQGQYRTVHDNAKKIGADNQRKQQQIADNEHAYQQLRAEYDKNVHQFEELQAVVDKLNELNETSDKLKDLNDRDSGAQMPTDEAVIQLESDKQRLSNELDQLGQSHKALKDESEKTIKNLRKELEEIQAALNRIEAVNREMTRENGHLRQRLSDYEISDPELRQEIEDLENREAALNKDVETLREINTRVADELGQKTIALDEAEKLAWTRKSECQALSDRLDAANEEIKMLEFSARQLREESQKFTIQVEAKTKEIQRLMTEKTGDTNEIEALTKQRDDLRRERASLNRELAAMTARIPSGRWEALLWSILGVPK